MIAFVEGILEEALPGTVIVNVHGLGWEIHVSLRLIDRLPPLGEKVKLFTYQHFTERGQSLFGFFSRAEKDLFLLLINHVSGLGPKLGLAVLSGMDVSEFQQKVASSDVAGLSKLKGVGKKTAERMVLELKDKVGVGNAWTVASSSTASAEDREDNDALLALLALGFKQSEAQDALKLVRTRLHESSQTLDSSALLREALRQLR